MCFAGYDLGLPPYGLVVPRLELDERLCQHAVAQGARFRANARVMKPTRGNGRVFGVEGEMEGRSFSPWTAFAPRTWLDLLI